MLSCRRQQQKRKHPCLSENKADVGHVWLILVIKLDVTANLCQSLSQLYFLFTNFIKEQIVPILVQNYVLK